MSRFFAAKSKKDKNLHDNSDDDDDDSEDDSDLSLSSDSDSGIKNRDTKQPAAKNEFAMFRRGDEDDSEDDSEEDDDSQDESDEEAKAAVAVKRGTFARAAYSDDSDESDDEDVKRTVKSARDKRFEEMRAIVKILNNAKKINDWVAIQTEFDKLLKAYTKIAAVQQREGGTPPRFYFRTLAHLEDFAKETNDNKDLVKKMNSLNAKSLNAMKQKLKKNNKTVEAEIAAWRDNPITEEESDAELAATLTAPETETSASTATQSKDNTNEDDSDEWPSEESESESESDSDSDDDDYPQDARSRVLRKYGKRPEKKKKEEDVFKTKKAKVKKQTEKPKAVEEEETTAAGSGGAAGEGDAAAGGFTPVGKGGKVIEITQENFFKRLAEFLEARGKKTTDKLVQIQNFTRLLEASVSAHQKIQVLIALIAAYFDYNPVLTGYMPVDMWKSTRGHIDTLLGLLEENPSIIVNDMEEEQLDPATNELRAIAGDDIRLRGDVNSFIDRLDDEFTKSLQNIDPHTTEYVERLKDETALYVLIVRSETYLMRINSTENLDATIMRRVEHLYYKPDQVISVIEAALPQKSAESPSNLVHQLCVRLYQTKNIRIRARALLCHVYHLALHGKYYEARDMLLMSHLQEQAQHTDIPTQILFNRTMVQLGLCAFRSGLVRESASALQEISSSGRVKELLAQGLQSSSRYGSGNEAVAKTAEQERSERARVLPFHMHVNLELLECVYLTCSMLLEVPNMAKHPYDSRRKIISKPFRRMLDFNDRQVFTGPPENTRDHIMAAAKALSLGEWEKCQEYISSIKIWDLMLDSSKIKEMLAVKIQEEALRTYLFQYAPYYDSLSLTQLSSMFDLSVSTVHAIISKMIVNEEIYASLDQPTGMLVLHRNAPGVEMSKLEYLAGVYADKVSNFVDNNDKLLEARSIALGLQQQQQGAQSFQGYKGSSSYSGRVGGGSGGNSGGGVGGSSNKRGKTGGASSKGGMGKSFART